MTHTNVFKRFQTMFPKLNYHDAIWFPNGKDSIRMRGLYNFDGTKCDFIFTYHGKTNWRLETVDSFLETK